MMTGVALVAADIGDPDSTRTVIAIIALLVVLGVALVMLAFWLRRATRPDPEFLAPLEVMGERSWRRGDPVWQRRRLDEVRPEDAVPLKKAALPPRLDESFDAGPSGSGFDDLRSDEELNPAAAEEAGGPADAADAVGDPDAGGAAEEMTDADGPVEAVVSESADVDERTVDRDVEDVEHDVDEVDDVGAVADISVGGAAEDEGFVDEDRAGAEDMRTPIGSPRPLLDDLPEHDIDPAVLEQAMVELDAELQRRGNDC